MYKTNGMTYGKDFERCLNNLFIYAICLSEYLHEKIHKYGSLFHKANSLSDERKPVSKTTKSMGK